MKYDFLIVGSGLFGAAFARRALDAGKTCLVLEKRPHTGGNAHCETIGGITVHRYGAHIFHTKDQRVWDFVNSYCEMRPYINSPVADYKGERYSLPFNMNTFRQMWGVADADEARRIIEGQKGSVSGTPRNLEEQAISLVGTDIYEKLIKHYTEKQWGKPCDQLPAFIIKRIPVRFTYDNNYFNDPYQGIPKGGYNPLIDALLDGADVRLGTDFNTDRDAYKALADTVVYTGTIDSYFDYALGRLEYRSLRFEIEELHQESFQGTAVVNYTDGDTPFTRIIEHKYFEEGPVRRNTVISREYPIAPSEGAEPFYPVNDEKNLSLLNAYEKRKEQEKNVCFGGRLAEFRYYDMDQTIASALALADSIL